MRCCAKACTRYPAKAHGCPWQHLHIHDPFQSGLSVDNDSRSAESMCETIGQHDRDQRDARELSRHRALMRLRGENRRTCHHVGVKRPHLIGTFSLLYFTVVVKMIASGIFQNDAMTS